jgi:hypothetical protein
MVSLPRGGALRVLPGTILINCQKLGKRSICLSGEFPDGITGLTTDRFKAALPEGLSIGAWGHRARINGGFPYLLNIPTR